MTRLLQLSEPLRPDAPVWPGNPPTAAIAGSTEAEVVLDLPKVSLDLAPHSEDDCSFSLVGHDDSRFV
jgi:hypothetical protein